MCRALAGHGKPGPASPRRGRRTADLAGRRYLTLLAAVVLAFFGATPDAVAQMRPRVDLLDTALLASPRLTESSGVAPSAIVPGVYWTHNDSGDGPFLYATDATGRDLGSVRVAGASAVDWEELAAGPCVAVPGRCLYVADIGDNRRHRRHVVVYRLREPAPPQGPSDTHGVVPLLDSLVLVYPDRPHNAEALVVTSDGALLLVVKDLGGPALLFRVTAGAGPAPRTLILMGALGMATSLVSGRVATGAAVSPDGSVLVVRTYVSLHFFRLRGDSLPVPLGSRSGVPIPVVEPQGEAVTFDGPDRLVLTSERGTAGHAILTRLRIDWHPEATRPPAH